MNKKPDKKWPISKISKSKWVFVKETIICSYEKALEEAAKLQKEDKVYKYRIWDCR